MQKLFVEELESRNLPSVTVFHQMLHEGLESGHHDPEPAAYSLGRPFAEMGASDRYQTELVEQVRSEGAGPNLDSAGLSLLDRYQTELLEQLNSASAGPNLDSAGLPLAIRYQTEVFERLSSLGAVPDIDLAGSFTPAGTETVEIVVVTPRALQATGLVDGPLLAGSTVRQAVAAALNSRPDSTVPSASPIALAANQRPAANNLAEVAVAASAGAGGAVAAGANEAVASALSSKGPPLLAAWGESVAASAFRNVAPTGANSNSAVKTGTEAGAAGEGQLDPMPSLPPVPQAPALELPQAPLAGSIQAGLANLPQFADLMTGISTLNLDRIEQRMANFITSLESTSSPAAAASQRDLYPWMLAAVVTGVACELARRQFRKPAAADGLDLGAFPIAPWELPRESENGFTSR
jgi:hypothetical protein